MPKLENQNDARLTLRAPLWMDTALKDAARKRRVPVAVVHRWALEEWLISEGFLTLSDDLDQTA